MTDKTKLTPPVGSQEQTDSETMPEPTTTLSMAIRNAAIGLAIFAFFTTGIISVTQQITADKIVKNERAYEAKLLLSLLTDDTDHIQQADQSDQQISPPESSSPSDTLLDSAQPLGSEDIERLDLLNVQPSNVFYQVYDSEGNVKTVILPLIAPEGYTESIRLIIGISSEASIVGVRVTKHKETPGLGDQIETEKSDWIYTFNNHSLYNPEESGWRVKKDGGDFDQMTGATITPRAIVKAIHQALEFFELNRDILLTKNELILSDTDQKISQ